MRIGEFAAASGVPIKTLRYYEEIGLFRPAGKHPLTRYRDYEPRQLPELAAVLALRDLGLPLAAIKSTLRGSSAAARRALLERAQRELRRDIEEKSRSLRWIAAELRRIGDPAAAPPVVLRRRPPLRVVSLRAQLGDSRDVVELERELLCLVPEPCRGAGRGTLWHRCQGDGAATAAIDAEHFVELAAPLRSLPQRLTVQTLPAVTAACAYSRDDEGAAQAAFVAVSSWLAEQGRSLVGAKREIYWPGLLEIQFPVALGSAQP
jgi:DNA-binding transcriptional MerR regulator